MITAFVNDNSIVCVVKGFFILLFIKSGLILLGASCNDGYLATDPIDRAVFTLGYALPRASCSVIKISLFTSTRDIGL